MWNLPSFALLTGVLVLLSESVSAADQTLLIGTTANERGIYASTLNLETGAMAPAQVAGDAPYPGFLALHPKLPLLYAVTREQEHPTGGLRAFRLDATTQLGTPKLVLVARTKSSGEGATHLAVDPTGQAVVIANYSSGSTALIRLDEEGSPEYSTAVIPHEGSSVHPSRQTKPHAHGVAIDSQSQFACVADLGTDEVIVYQILAGETLKRHSAWSAKPGAGPRHLSFHPNGRWLYCINELDNTLTALTFDDKSGKLTELQTLRTLPSDFQAPNTTAEVVVHPSGRFVYCSNRGHDSTAVFSIDANTGRLTLIEIEPTQGSHPRFIGLEPSGNYLIAANRDADNLVSFRIDLATGALTPTGHQVAVPGPVCVVFPRMQP